MAMELDVKFIGQATGDIKGSNTITGREGTSRCVAFHHKIDLPTDRATGRVVGNRVHYEGEIIMELDAAVPSIYKMLCNGESATEIKLNFYKITPEGNEVVYWTETIKEAKITRLETIAPMTWDPQYDKFNHYAVVGVRFEKLEKKFVDGAIMYEDDFKAARA